MGTSREVIKEENRELADDRTMIGMIEDIRIELNHIGTEFMPSTGIPKRAPSSSGIFTYADRVENDFRTLFVKSKEHAKLGVKMESQLKSLGMDRSIMGLEELRTIELNSRIVNVVSAQMRYFRKLRIELKNYFAAIGDPDKQRNISLVVSKNTNILSRRLMVVLTYTKSLAALDVKVSRMFRAQNTQ
jgi:hypothetical protein